MGRLRDKSRDKIRVLVRHKGDRADLLLYYRDPDTGREVSRSSETSDRMEAERAAARWEEEVNQFRGDGSGWDYFLLRFEDEHLAFKAKKTRSSYTTAFGVFRKFYVAGEVSGITASTLSQFASWLASKGYPSTSIKSYLTHIRGGLNWAKKMGMIRDAPHVPMPKVAKRRHARGRDLTHDEYQAMRALATPAYQRMLDLLWLSGMRLGEAMLLDWRRPPVRVSLDAKPHPQIVFDSDGHKSGRDDAMPIPPDFHEWLLKTPESERKGLVAPVSKSLIKASKAITELGEKAKVVVSENTRRGRESPVKYASAHDFRRAFGTRWAPKVRPLTLKAMMRHESLETTLKHYIGLTSADAGSELWHRDNANG